MSDSRGLQQHVEDGADEAGRPPVDRRRFLRSMIGRGAAVAAGAGAASAVLAGAADQAGAADNGTLNIGQANIGTMTTGLTGSKFKVVDGNAGGSLVAITTVIDNIAFEATADSGAALRVTPDGNAIPMPPTTGNWSAGSMRVDQNGDLWYCFAAGAGAASGWYPLSLVPALIPLAAPQRIYDSRPGQNPMSVVKGMLFPLAERDVDSTLGGFVPLTAFAVLLNFTITGTASTGFMGVRQAGTAFSGASSINWFGPGQTLANNATTGINNTGMFTVRGGGSPAHFLCDVMGYYTLTA